MESLMLTNRCQYNISAIRIRYSTQVAASKRIKLEPLNEQDVLSGYHLVIDSHTDMSCLGCNARIIYYMDETSCTVYSFNDRCKPLENIHH